MLTESSSLNEKKPVECKPVPAPKKNTSTSAVLKNTSIIKKDLRQDIEQTLIVKLESLGVKPVSSLWRKSQM